MKELGSDLNILVCQKSLIPTWIEHFKKYYPQYEVIDMTVKKSSQYFLENQNQIGKCVLVVNYDLIFRRKFFLQLENYTLMLDESSMIQNETAKRSKFILQMKPDNVILLSGTPTSGKYENLWSQLRLLGWNISKDLYWKHYIETEWMESDGFFRKVVVGYKNVDRLKMKLNQYGAVFMKSDEVIELPEQIFTNVMVGTTKEYRKFMRDRLVTIEDVELVGDTALTTRLYARMLCGQYNREKLDAFKDLVESTEDRLVVFYNFNDELDKLLTLIGDKPFSIVNGSTKDLTAYEDESNSVTFVQYQAGAMGINLQKATKAIYFTLPQSSELFDQSHKRIHRIGQTNRCFYYYLMCRGSVEEHILENLKMRRDYTDELFKAYQEQS